MKIRKRKAIVATALSGLMAMGIVPVNMDAALGVTNKFPITVDYSTDVGAVEHIGGGNLHAFDDRGPAQWLTDGIGITAIRGQDYSRRANIYNEYLPGWFEPGTHDRLQGINPNAKMMIGTYYGYKGKVARGEYGGNTDWKALAQQNGGAAYKEYIATVLGDAKRKGIDVYSWVLWNEPDLQWSNRNAYFVGHKNAYDGVKAIDAGARVQAPELTAFNLDYLTSFLAYCKANNCIPDVLSWHELTKDRTAIEEHTTQITRWLESNDIPVMPFAITEYQGTGYSTTEQGRREQGNYNPGLAVSYLGEFERASESSTLAYALRSQWGLSGGDPEARGYLGEMTTFDDKGKMATGLWYVYNAYWDMTGRKVGTTHDKTNIDVVATYDAHEEVNQSHLLVGNWQENAKSIPVTLTNIPEGLVVDGRINVRADQISETLATASFGTTPLLARNVAVLNGTATIDLDVPARAAINVVLTPPTGSPTKFTAAGGSGTQQAIVSTTGTLTSQSRMFQGTPYVAYVGGAASSYRDASGAETAVESGDSATYTVTVPQSAVYRLETDLVASPSGGFVQLYVDGVSTGSPFSFYAGSEQLRRKTHANVHLDAGSHELTYRIVGTGKEPASAGRDINVASVSLAAPGSPVSEAVITTDAQTGAEGDVTVHYVSIGDLLGGAAATLTRTNHVFDGWNTAADGSGRDVTSSMIATGNLTLYAQWRSLGEAAYFVDAGDLNPSTVSPGAALGTNNSVTDQFYGPDPATGKMWGVQDAPKASTEYAGLLTGEHTWPAENLGYTDASSSLQTYRYARGQSQPFGQRLGVPYKFELPDGDYEVSLAIATGWVSQVDRGFKATVTFDKGTARSVTALPPTLLSKDLANPIRVRSVATVSGGSLTINVDTADSTSTSVMVNEIVIRPVIDRKTGPAVTAVAYTRCVAGKAMVVAAVSNESNETVSADVSSPHGASNVNLAAGKTNSTLHSSRAAAVPAGKVSVTATGAGGVTKLEASYTTRSCG